MTRSSTGIPDLDRLIASRGRIPAAATDIDDVGYDESVVTVSNKTRNLERLGERPALRHLVARAIDDQTLSRIVAAPNIVELRLNGSRLTSLLALRRHRRL